MKRSDFLWEGPRPSVLLWRKMLKKYHPSKKRGTVLKLLTLEDLFNNHEWLRERGLCYFSGGGVYFERGVRQKVQPHCSWDTALKKKGSGFFKVREVCQIKGVGFSGGELFGPFQKGTEGSVGSLKGLLRVIDELKRGFKKRGDRLSELELSHFHPSLEIIEKNRESGAEKFVFNGLSQSDLFFQHRLYRELQGEFSLRIKAVLPSGHSYSSPLFKSFHPL